MADQHVLCLRWINPGRESFALLHVEANGPHSLDLNLVGTDGESVFVGSVRQNRASKLRASNYDGSETEWESALTKTLLGKADEDSHMDALTGLECVADISPSGDELEIIWRRNVSGITQRLGTFTLPRTDSQEIELFDWTCLAATATHTAQTSLAHLTQTLKSQQATIAALTQQLDTLIQAKAQHEEALLLKFTQLVNAKKLKIRDQQRLLATARVDEGVAREVERVRMAGAGEGGKVGRRAGLLRGSKRKADTEGVVSAEESEEESEGFEEMAVDEQEEDEEEVREVVTPEGSEDETASEVDTSLPPLSEQKKGVRGMIGGKGSVARGAERKVASQESGVSSRTKGKSNEAEVVEALPPRRDLPFTRKNVASVGQTEGEKQEQPAPEDDETEDEL